MGQTCKTGVTSCVDCGFVSPNEMVSEPSKKFDLQIAEFKETEKHAEISCVERLNRPLDLYEREFLIVRKEKEGRKSLDDSFRNKGSPRVKIISSNVSEKSVNLIDRIDRTAETDKTSNSVFFLQNMK